jgi:hypothetical protein
MGRETFDVHLVNQQLFERQVRRRNALAIEGIVNEVCARAFADRMDALLLFRL